ncbi:MAG: YkgJ family cysteine cluster protein [Butyrivibrio sp.]
MFRDVDLNDISDGKEYTSSDMARVDCNGCMGCSKCCHGMGKSLELDPLDIFNIIKATGYGISELLNKYIELSVSGGIILPNIKMSGKDEACLFLNDEGRCTIHKYRPGICRMFPLGRIFKDRGHLYFNQIYECPYESKTKIKIKNWMNIPDLDRYEKFVDDWHDVKMEIMEEVMNTDDMDARGQICTGFLQLFYVNPYNTDGDFYTQFYERLDFIKKQTI